MNTEMRKLLSIISVLSILIMVTVGTAVADTSSTDKKQNSRLSALESSVKNILTRLTDVENKLKNVQTPPYSAAFGTWTEYKSCSGSNVCYDYSFTLDKDSNVFVMVTGELLSMNMTADNIRFSTKVDVDDSMSGTWPDWIFPVPHSKLSMSKNFKLKAGTHTLHIYSASSDGNGNSFDTAISDLTISVIANQNGKIDAPNDYYGP